MAVAELQDMKTIPLEIPPPIRVLWVRSPSGENEPIGELPRGWPLPRVGDTLVMQTERMLEIGSDPNGSHLHVVAVEHNLAAESWVEQNDTGHFEEVIGYEITVVVESDPTP